jgi:hypothetical protein
MRQYSEQELNQMMTAEEELDRKHGLILLDNSPTAKANAVVLNEYFNNHNIPMSVSSMIAAAYALKDKLDWKSPAQVEFSEVLARLEPAQCLVVNSWYKKQSRLKTDGDEGLRTINQIVSWLLNRRYAVTESGLDMALTNVQNNSRRPLFWKESPKQSREYVGSRPNHAFGQTEKPKALAVNEREYVNGRKNHSFHAKTDQPRQSTPPFDAWQEIVKRYMTQWNTHGQKATLQAEYDRGIATGKTWREIGASLGQIVKSWQRGRQ